MIDVPRMMEIAQEMTRISLDAYVQEDPDMVLPLIEYDDEVDALYKQVRSELLVLAVEEPHTIKQAAQLLLLPGIWSGSLITLQMWGSLFIIWSRVSVRN